MLNRRQLLKKSTSLLLFPCLIDFGSTKETNKLSPMAQEIEKYFLFSIHGNDGMILDPYKIDGFYVQEGLLRYRRHGVYWLWDRENTPHGQFCGCSTDFSIKNLKFKYGEDYYNKFKEAVNELNSKYSCTAK